MITKPELRQVPGFGGKYYADSSGSIYTSYRAPNGTVKKMKTQISPSGYVTIVVCDNGKPTRTNAHRLVAMAWYGRFDSLHVNHKNGVRVDNRPENLEWCTPSENVKYTFRVLNYKQASGADDSQSKPVMQFDKTGRFIAKYASMTIAAYAVGRLPSNISAVIRGKCRTSAGYIWKLANDNNESRNMRQGK